MSQITKSAQAKPRTSDEFYGRAITATLALAAAMIVVAFLLTRPASTVPTGAAGARDLTDGFLPGAVAAHSAAQIRDAQSLTGGWEARLVPPKVTSQGAVRDGWEAGLLAGVTPTADIRDGWESSLIK
jgi:hypothetical protein